MQRYINEVYHGKNRDVKKEDSGNFISFETVQKRVEDKKPFTCEICSKSFNSKFNMQRHISEVHHGKHRDVKKEDSGNFIGFETVQDENKYIESVLNSVKTDFERKRELGEKAMEMIEKYELDVQKMPEEVKDAIRFNLKMVVKD